MNKIRSRRSRLGQVSIILAALLLTPSFLFAHKNEPSNDGGVLITDKVEDGPIFYPADYSSDITNEPSYATQNSYTFSSMNFGNTHKYYRGDSVKVAVIDSGLNYTHEDFKNSNNNQIIQGHSRTIDSSSGSWLYYQFDAGYQSKINDTLGHGTNVASVIASQINALGCAGIAPNVELYVYKVTNTSNGYEWTAINSALTYCISEGIDVINMSFQAYEHAVTYNGSTMSASTGCSSVMTSYINSCYNAGITLVAAAGNYNTSEPSYPASNNHVISVGSLAESSTTTKAAYSNTYGIDLVAPGTVYVADKGTNSAYKKTSGTSFSSPIVTAAIALYKQKHPSATPAEIESALYASCDSISGNPGWAGNGRLNVEKFLDIPDVGPIDIQINNPEIVNEELELEIGDYLDLDWTVNGEGTFDDSVNFYTLSGENSVVSVNSSGRITATGVGEDYVVIESNADSNVYTSVYVTVTSSGGSPTVSSVSVSPSSISLDLNGTKTANLSATVNGDNNPSQAVTWSSSNTSIATVSASGVVTAKATGNATITATSQADQTKSGTCTVTVTDSTVHVSSVSLNKNSTSIEAGSSETLTATVSPNNATNKSVTWQSSNTSIATVDSAGKVTGVSAGNATITVTTVDGSKTATCTVTVTAKAGPSDSTQYSLITSTDDLEVGKSYLIAGGTSGTVKTMAVTSNGNNRPTTELTVSNSKLTRGLSALSVTLGGSSGAYTFKTDNYAGTAGYLNATSTTGSNYLQVVSNLDAYAYFSISFSNSQAVITCTGKSSRNIIRVNTSGTPIACYSSGQNPVYLWKEVTNKTLSSISIQTAPTKTNYSLGEYFDPTGLVINRVYSDSSSDTYSYAGHTSEFTFTPGLNTALATNNSSVTITYGGKSCSQAISVKELSSISISGYTTSFLEGDSFSFGGIVTANYSDSTSANVTSSATFTGYNMTSVGNQTVTVSYGGKSTTYSITVSAGTPSSISLSGQTTNYVKNQPFSFDGTCTVTFTNGYQKVVTPTSVSSPNMSTSGVKTVTVTYLTVSTTYDITVSSSRVVYETTTTTGYSVIGTITYPNNTKTISVDTLSVSTGGYTTIESNAIRLGSGSSTGTITVTSTTSNITKIVVSAKTYGSDTGVTLNIDGTGNSITSSYADYSKEFATATNSVAIATTTSKKRAYIQTITVYETKETEIQTDISNSEDCLGLETFIDSYLHFEYTENLGYCKDSEHHYYATAKTAFNALNSHQRKLFTENSAYSVERARLSAWATANGDTLNSSSVLTSAPKINPIITSSNPNTIVIVIVASLIAVTAIGGYFFLRRKED